MVIRTYDLRRIIANSGETHLSKEDIGQFEAQCVDCERWITQYAHCCACGSLVAWKGSKIWNRMYLIRSETTPVPIQRFLTVAGTNRLNNGREYHRFIIANSRLGARRTREVLERVKTDLVRRKQFSSRAFVRYALNALELAVEQGKPESKSTLLEGDDVFRG